MHSLCLVWTSCQMFIKGLFIPSVSGNTCVDAAWKNIMVLYLYHSHQVSAIVLALMGSRPIPKLNADAGSEQGLRFLSHTKKVHHSIAATFVSHWFPVWCERGLDISSDVLKRCSAECFTCLRCVDSLCIQVYSYSQQMRNISQIFFLSTTLDSLPISITMGYLAHAHTHARTYTSTYTLLTGFLLQVGNG